MEWPKCPSFNLTSPIEGIQVSSWPYDKRVTYQMVLIDALQLRSLFTFHALPTMGHLLPRLEFQKPTFPKTTREPTLLVVFSLNEGVFFKQ
mgnify:CR=1 FL=1